MKTLLSCVAAGALVLAGLAPAQQPAFALHPCDVPGVQSKARCGTYEVWENRGSKTGRKIGLKVVVLPPTGQMSGPDAIAFLAGGPGDAATRSAPFIATLFASARAHRDVLLVDQRGTGGSHALECDLYPGSDPQVALGAFYPADRVRACRAQIEKEADLGQYTTSNFVDDLDEVRAALGYQQLDLFGGSYGTRAALVFMRRHPEHARLAVLQGVTPPDDPMPLHFPQYAQGAIDRLFADCAADPACKAAFPDLAGDLRAIVQRTSSKPVPVEITDPTTGAPVQVTLSRNLLGEALRYLMYQSSTALFIPALVHQAASKGDLTLLAEFALSSRRQLVNGLGQGLYLSVTCAEDLPFITPAQAREAAANTFLGNYRYEQQRAACDAWGRGAIPPDFHEPVRASVPVLMFSGTWDPVTPPSGAEHAATTLPRSRSLVFAGGGHDYEGLPGAPQCEAAMAAAAIERGDVAGVDASCIDRIRRAPFPTAPPETKIVTLAPAQLAALEGHYAGAGAPPIDLHVEGTKVTATIQGQPSPFVLVPVSPTRLRLLGDIGTYLDFDIVEGKATRAALEQGGVKTLTWTRQ